MTRGDAGRLCPGDVGFLACPICRAALAFEGRAERGFLLDGALRCKGATRHDWDVRDGLPELYLEEEVRGSDRFMRAIYNGLPSLHDPLTALLAPIVRVPLEPGAGHPYIRRMDLGSLRARPKPSGPIRILDVGAGTGADLPLVLAALPPDLDVEIWGMDLSRGMLSHCRRRVARDGHAGVRLLLADAHFLPFADGTFDRVFHVGALNSFRDPARALAEMARVAAAGTPIVVVDEQLADPVDADHGRSRRWLDRALFRFLTFYDDDPHCPRELLPPGATQILEEQASRFYYVLTFSMPAAFVGSSP